MPNIKSCQGGLEAWFLRRWAWFFRASLGARSPRQRQLRAEMGSLESTLARVGRALQSAKNLLDYENSYFQ